MQHTIWWLQRTCLYNIFESCLKEILRVVITRKKNLGKPYAWWITLLGPKDTASSSSGFFTSQSTCCSGPFKNSTGKESLQYWVLSQVHLSAKENESLTYVSGILGQGSPVLPPFPTSFPFSLLDHSQEQTNVLHFSHLGSNPFWHCFLLQILPEMGHASSWSWQGRRWIGCIRGNDVETDTGFLVFSLCRDLQAVPYKACIPEMEAGVGRIIAGEGPRLLGPLVILGEPGACA